jgi:Lrp/AsnC family transcriptional regulator, regulator for asnA, asnC and gidA
MGKRWDLDKVDSAILRLLQKNSRMSYQEMSKQTGISDATIQFRLKRMKARGIIDKFTVVANPALLGYAVMAVMLVQTDTDKHDDAKLALAKIPEITEVYSILGEYDLLIKVWAGSLTELNTVMNEKIRAVDGIEDLLEMVVVERVKEEMPPV